ncbi:YodC family protein [Aeromonas media]|uniref:YodC family protein n=1 Tax=Aeromonas media TaxID=651 RepID=UPI003D062CDD
MSDFKVGDVVKLKSGGPDMTVNRIEEVNRFRCIWFLADGTPQTGVFAPEGLEKSGS